MPIAWGLVSSSIQLVPDGTMLLHIVLVLAMVAVLNQLFFRPISSILEERAREGGSTLDRALEISRAVDREVAKYETALQAARADGYQRTEAYRKAELRDREANLKSVKTEALNLLETEKSLIEKQAAEVRDSLGVETEAIALEIQNRILKRLEGRRGLR